MLTGTKSITLGACNPQPYRPMQNQPPPESAQSGTHKYSYRGDDPLRSPQWLQARMGHLLRSSPNSSHNLTFLNPSNAVSGSSLGARYFAIASLSQVARCADHSYTENCPGRPAWLILRLRSSHRASFLHLPDTARGAHHHFCLTGPAMIWDLIEQ